MSLPPELSLQQLLEALLDEDTPLHPRFLYRLSDLEPEEIEQLADIWPRLPLWRKRALLEDVVELSEKDTLLSFLSLGRYAAQDEDARVRVLAVHILWEYEDKDLIPLYLKMLDTDREADVRAAAAGALGNYVSAGEMEEIPAKILHQIEERLLKVISSSDAPQVRRAALEALGYSSRKDVAPLIQEAFASKEKEWIASALFAMGRSGEESWNHQVLEMLSSPLPLLRGEAAHAAGELSISEAVPLLLELLDDPDDATRQASMWSLSQLGGEGVREALEAIYEESEDDQEIAFLEEVLDNLAFVEGAPLRPIIEFPQTEEDQEDESDLYDLLDDYEDDEEAED
ncbi:MAG: HEAT repeat domain-containing protein [Anaerolineales bacterium]|nr:HEAT repeat domain-containing protein [Anaerolineales bacterium]